MRNLVSVNKELIEIENKMIECMEKESMKEYLIFHQLFINKNREWRDELLKDVEQKINQRNLNELLSKEISKN